MPSPPLDNIHGWTTSDVACHHRLWAAKMVERHRACHDITALGLHAQSDDVGRGVTSPRLDGTHGKTTTSVALHHYYWTARMVGNVGRGMTSPPLDSTHGRTMSGLTCYHCLWTTHMIELRRAWHEITAFGQHTRSNDIGHGIPSSPLGSTHGRTASGMVCHHRP